MHITELLNGRPRTWTWVSGFHSLGCSLTTLYCLWCGTWPRPRRLRQWTPLPRRGNPWARSHTELKQAACPFSVWRLDRGREATGRPWSAVEKAHSPLHTAALRNEGKEKMQAKAGSTSNHRDRGGDISLRAQPCSPGASDFEFRLCRLVAVWPWESQSTSLNISFLISKTGHLFTELFYGETR